MPFPIEVIAFGDEEGSRFPAAMLCSRAVAGSLDADALEVVDGSGTRLAEAGIDVAAFRSAARRRGDVLAYLEAHIEQGPVLEAEGLAVGTVDGIASQLRCAVAVTGRAAHAGTTTMTLRRDALAGAAEMVVAIEAIARDAASDLVATVGRFEALPGAANVVPGEVRFTLDLRSGDPARRDAAADAMLGRIAAIARARNLAVAVARVHDLPACPCDLVLMDVMDAAVVDSGQRVRRLVSGAGHDAMVMAGLCPVVMLFIRCRDGVSHHPAEHVDPADAEIALRIMLRFVARLEHQPIGRRAVKARGVAPGPHEGRSPSNPFASDLGLSMDGPGTCRTDG